MPTLTRDTAWATATDAADRQMRAEGRDAWDSEDLELAINTFELLGPVGSDALDLQPVITA